MRTKAAGFTLVELMVVCSILAPILYLFLSAGPSVGDALGVNQRNADVAQKARIGLSSICNSLRSASARSLLVRVASSWVTPVEGTAYGTIQFQEPAGLPTASTVALQAPRMLEFKLDPKEIQNGIDDDGDGLVDEGSVWTTRSGGERACLASDIESFSVVKTGRLLRITIQSCALDSKQRPHRSKSVQTMVLRND